MSADYTANKKLEKAKLLFDEGLVKEFKDLFDVVPYSVMAKKLNTNNVRFKAKLDEPSSLKIGELQVIASILNIDPVALFALAIKDKLVQIET